MLGDYIRIALSLLLLAFVYFETGWATTLTLFLICARSEILDYNEGRTFRRASSDSGAKRG